MPINIQDYLLGRIPVGRKIDIPSYLMAKAASGGIQEITDTLPIYVRSRASQVLKNYRFYGTASGVGVETENLFNGNGAYSRISKNSTVEFQSGTLVVSNGYGVYFDIDITTNTNYSIKVNPQDSTDYLTFTAVLLPSNTRIVGYSSTLVSNTFNSGSDNKIQMVFYSGRSASSEAYSVYSDIMLTKSSTPPSSYIPYGYKLPITVTSNGTTTDYPIYIGDSKLGEEEYVDYTEQKIYKRGENEFPFAEEGTFTFGNGSVISDGAGTFIINTENNDTNVPSELIPLTTPYTVPQTNGEYTFYLGNASTNNPGLLIVFYDSEKKLVDDWMYNSTWRKESYISLMVGKTIAYVGFRINTNYSGSANMSVTPMISKNNNLTTYVPYIQPTDPPVPLPDITLSQGEVTIDIDGDLKPQATVKGRIEQIT